MKDLLIEQISEELNSGNTNTLEMLLSKLEEKQILDNLNVEKKQIFEDRKPNFSLKEGMLIKAKADLRGVSNSYNTPERIDITKGTVLRVPNSGTNRGDVFCDVVEGECIKHCRGYSEGEKINVSDSVGLTQGVNTRCPYDLGVADKLFWEIVE